MKANAVTIYGIKNCDTMKKARAWLDNRGVAYRFHDYKTAGIERGQLEAWAREAGWETLLNRAGTTFRKLPEKDKDVKRDMPATARVERPGVYVLQAGSYRNEADADRVRAQLSMQGIDAKVQRVAVDADVWHRVRIGPITKLDELNKLRKQLQAADVDALVIRVGD